MLRTQIRKGTCGLPCTRHTQMLQEHVGPRVPPWRAVRAPEALQWCLSRGSHSACAQGCVAVSVQGLLGSAGQPTESWHGKVCVRMCASRAHTLVGLWVYTRLPSQPQNTYLDVAHEGSWLSK